GGGEQALPGQHLHEPASGRVERPPWGGDADEFGAEAVDEGQWADSQRTPFGNTGRATGLPADPPWSTGQACGDRESRHATARRADQRWRRAGNERGHPRRGGRRPVGGGVMVGEVGTQVVRVPLRETWSRPRAAPTELRELARSIA